MVMVFPLALWLPETNFVRKLALMLSCTNLIGLTFIGQSHILDFVLQNGIPLFLFARNRNKHSARSPLPDLHNVLMPS
jgi:hypothetical protein